MTNRIRLIAAAACAAFALAAHPAAVPLRWAVETSRAEPAKFDAYRGETLAFEAALKTAGRPLQAPSDYALYWQTNGMGTAWWSAPCTAPVTPTNVLFATWSPTNDVGARAYTCFIGAPGTIYHAAFQLRLRESPGTHPNELPLPTPTIDFARVEVLNPPWPSLETVPPIVSNVVTRQYVESLGIAGGVTTNDVAAITAAAIATNATVIAATNGVSVNSAAIATNAANIATNAAEIAAIPRITESVGHPGWAEHANFAETATVAFDANSALQAYEANRALKADRAELLYSISGPSYTPDAIAVIEQAATNAEVQASVNAVAISAETTRATAAESALQAQIDLFKSFTAVVTNALPATGEDGCIYLVPIDGTDNKAEWLWVHEPSNHWEKIGTTAIDMAEYAKSSELSTEAAARSAGDAENAGAISNHVSDQGNPHGVTAEQVGALPFVDGVINDRAEVYDQWYFYGGLFLCNGSDTGVGLNSVGPSASRLMVDTNEGVFYTPEGKGGGTFALTSDIPDVSGIASNAAAIVEVAQAATNYTDAATNALTLSVSHPTSLWSDADPKSAGCTNRLDSFGNLYKGETVAGGSWVWYGRKADRCIRTEYYLKGPWFRWLDENNRTLVEYWAGTGHLQDYDSSYNYREGDTYKGLDPFAGDDLTPTGGVIVGNCTFTPQGAPAFSPTPYDRFARSSELPEVGNYAAVSNAAMNANAYTDAAVATLREKTDLAVYEPANAHWVWTSTDANTPAGWLDKANEYNSPKPTHNGTSWTVEQIYNSPLYAAPADPATGTNLVFVFKVSRFGSATFTATATRTSATDTTPVAVSGPSLASTYDLMSLTNQTGVAIGLNSSRASTGVAIGQNASAVLSAVAVGGSAVVSGANGLAVGAASNVAGPYSAAFGPSAKTGSAAMMSVQLGAGTCNAANTLQFYGAPLGKVDAFYQTTFTLDTGVVVPQAVAVSNYVEFVVGDISAVLDAIIGGH